ncbi:hypothetical protein P692DRAFT_201812023 [Suillus brevipes Sb2]|nr:hypothetical protein P692DRAFT_201812023 [Suillus brevipes Sb2]
MADQMCKGKILKKVKNVKNAIFYHFVPVERSYMLGTLFASSYSQKPKNANLFCVFWRFRGSNKDGNIFIYTTKHVLNAPRHFPAKGAKYGLLEQVFGLLGAIYIITPVRHFSNKRNSTKILYHDYSVIAIDEVVYLDLAWLFSNQ